MVSKEEFEKSKSVVDEYIKQLQINSVSKRFSLDEIKEILFKYEMKYHVFKPETTKEFSQQEIERFTKYHIDDFLKESNVC